MTATEETPRCTECGEPFTIYGDEYRVCTGGCTWQPSADDEWRMTSAPKSNLGGLTRLRTGSEGTALLTSDAATTPVSRFGADLDDQSSGTEFEHLNPQLRRLDSVEAEVVEFLWRPYVPRRKLTLLEGDPGVGKSWVSLAIAAAVSRGSGPPGMEFAQPGVVLLLTAEDGLADTVRPRLDVLGANSGRIVAIEGPLTLDDDGLSLLDRYLAEVQPSLVVIDPLVAYLGPGLDLYRPNQTRPVMMALARLAERHDSAFLLVRHLTKAEKAKAIYRGLGSIDLTGACRSVVLAGSDPDDPQQRAIVHIKSNLAALGDGMGYALQAGRFAWTGPSELSAGRILASEGGESPSAIGEASEFLREMLATGPVSVGDIQQAAKELGITAATLRRAKARIGVTSVPIHERGKKGARGWDWTLGQSGPPEDSGDHPRYTGDEHVNHAPAEGAPERAKGHEHLNGAAPYTVGLWQEDVGSG